MIILGTGKFENNVEKAFGIEVKTIDVATTEQKAEEIANTTASRERSLVLEFE